LLLHSPTGYTQKRKIIKKNPKFIQTSNLAIDNEITIMAPQNNRIVTLNDVTNNRNRVAEDSSSSKANPTSSSNPLAAEYCQPASNNNNSNIKLCHIPGLPLDDVCEQTLKRIHQEYLPIIQRRGYHVLSISEMCCCGDGLDHATAPSTTKRGGRRKQQRKLRKQSNNVWGYNMTRFGRPKTHTIHLRLRDPQNHARLLPWEDVAGTMGHELSHCVHQNHGAGFYKLMEEILEEHCVAQVNASGMTFAPLNAHAVQRDTSTAGTNTNATSTTTTALLPTSGGNRLGGNSATKGGGKSRLLQGGQALGGRKGQDPASLREAMARAAEMRRRVMERTRRMIERSKEPCVIELLDDDDDDDDDNDDAQQGSNTLDHRKPRAKLKRAASKEDEKKETLKLKPKYPSKKSTSGVAKKPKVDLIDLTEEEDSAATTTPKAATIHSGGQWACGQCTFRNKPLALVCDVCLSEKRVL
jgi:hypothetical protein